MRHGVSGRFGVGMLLGVTAMVFASSGPVSADVVLCKSALDGSVQARERTCRTGESEIAMSSRNHGSATGDKASIMQTNVTQTHAVIECDAHEDLYWLKDNTPVN